MRLAAILLALVCCGLIHPAQAQSTAARMPGAEQDLAWLSRHLDAEAAARRKQGGPSGPEIAFASLAQRVGTPVRVTLRDGRSRFGVIEHANARGARLRVRLGAGEYMLDFDAASVARITER